MRRLGFSLCTMAVVGALHVHPHGSKADYLGLFLAAVATWVAVPGPGEAAMIAAGISAAHGHLDLASVLIVGWAGAIVGGNAGWVAGLKAGRAVLTAPGPLHRLRLNTIERGDRFYERYGMVAALISPTWIAGIHGMRWLRFLPVNAVAALGWALLVGLGAYLVGPSIADVAADAGVAVGLLVLGIVIAAVVVARRRRSRQPS